MNPHCACGGRLRRSDLAPFNVKVKNGQYLMLMGDTDPFVSHWICDGCGVKKTQRKRQPKKTTK